MSDLSVLYLRLEGPLQSWGDRARWSIRDSRRFPTKSGVLGVLACALGWGPDDGEPILELAAACRLAVRADRPGELLRDFHTVEGGVLSAEGKLKSRIKKTASTGLPETVTSEREYLADACFLAAIAAPAAVAASLAAALADPVWPPFLGRRSCLPTAPVWPVAPGAGEPAPLSDEPTALAQAITAHPWLVEPTGRPPQRLSYEWEPAPDYRPDRGQLSWRLDQPRSIRPRVFTARPAVADACPLPQPAESLG